MSPWLVLLVPGACAVVLALWLLSTSRHRVRFAKKGARRWGRVLLGVPLLLSGLALCLMAWSLRHYLAFAAETEVAQIALRQTGVQRYRAELSTAGQARSFDLAGDEWQLDARVLNWTLPAQLGGAPSLYRLERLSGRYGDVKQELDAPRTVFALSPAGALDLWQLKRSYPAALPFVDAQFGSAAYLPMLDGAKYRVSLGRRGGLVARPADKATHDLLLESGWLQE